MATRANSKPCQISEMDLFPYVVTGYRGKCFRKIALTTYLGK